jgi:predicted DCC family thiol-disulfide oxidoreductase YuxK
MIERGKDHLLFDGDCGVCVYFSEIARKMDARKGFIIEAYQSYPETELMEYGITYGQCAKNLQAITRKGRVYQGAFAVNYFLWRHFPWTLLAVLIYGLPPVLLFEIIGYRLVADNRRRISQWFGLNACLLRDHDRLKHQS